ncbi:MAG TPA: helix-turn-helix transcriptional regulator [Streptosporangiaceae bacterium]|nr:helix-turn-helix transcriptional regulator [Streptosporangiaceae bacterium]
MEARSLPEALKLIMEQRGCSQNQLARDLKKGQPWISNVIRGKAGLEFARVIKILSRVGWEVVIRPKSENSEPVKRREFVAAAASVMFVPSPKVGPDQDPAYVGELARSVQSGRYALGSGAIAATAIRHIQRIVPTAMGSRDRALHEAASELAVQTVWTLSEARRLDAGENIGKLALKLAQLSKSPGVQSRAYGALAQTKIERHKAQRQPDRALMYAREGMKVREVSDVRQAWMRLRKGWSLAQVRGQEKQARDEIENVRGLLQDSRGFGQSPVSVADMTGCIGLALNDLGAHEEAQTTLNEAVALLGNSAPDLQSHFLAQQIIAALKTSQVSLAANRMLHLARVAPLVNAPRLDEDLQAVLALSATWSTVPSVRDARDQLKTVTVRNIRT